MAMRDATVEEQGPPEPSSEPLLEASDRPSREELHREADGLLKSRVFPGLWFDTSALLPGDMKSVRSVLWRGLDRLEHVGLAGR